VGFKYFILETKGEFMPTKIEITQLRKADIIISTTASKISKAIKKGIGTDYSHAILYLGNLEVLEAIGDGVTRRSWDKSIHDPEGEMTLGIALRRKNMTDIARQAVCDAAMKYQNLPYDVTGALGSGMFGNRRGSVIGTIGCSILPLGCAIGLAEVNENAKDENADNKFFCSELVSRAFTAAGYPIVDGKATWQTPRAIRLSSYLIYVGHLIGGK
jgi:cell wall-associated NlpC family hydrolase